MEALLKSQVLKMRRRFLTPCLATCHNEMMPFSLTSDHSRYCQNETELPFSSPITKVSFVYTGSGSGGGGSYFAMLWSQSPPPGQLDLAIPKAF